MVSSVGTGVIFLFLERWDEVMERTDVADEDILRATLSTGAFGVSLLVCPCRMGAGICVGARTSLPFSSTASNSDGFESGRDELVSFADLGPRAEVCNFLLGRVDELAP